MPTALKPVRLVRLQSIAAHRVIGRKWTGTATASLANPIMGGDALSAALLAVARSTAMPMAHKSGSVFYSGRLAFSKPSSVYVLGLNPGGSPLRQATETVKDDLDAWNDRPRDWSRYLDESWRGKLPGRHGMQPRIRHMFDTLGLDLRATPASNAVFVRTKSEADLRREGAGLFDRCWSFHEAVLERLGVRTVLCLGSTTGRWVRRAVQAHLLLDSYRETNNRGWSSEAHIAANGLAVITLTHPGRANWANPDANPTGMVKAVLSR